MKTLIIENLSPGKQQQVKFAALSGWTEITFTELWGLYGVPPEDHIDRKAVEMSGIKCKVEPIPELIDNMQAGPGLDTLVAEILGYNVLGIVECLSDPECTRYYLSYKGPLDSWVSEPGTLRPVYLDRCACEFTEPGDQDYFGHNAGCLSVVKEYSRSDEFAFGIVDWLVEQGYSVTVTTYSNESFCHIFEPDDRWEPNEFVQQTFRWLTTSRGDTRPLVICHALLKIFVQSLEDNERKRK